MPLPAQEKKTRAFIDELVKRLKRGHKISLTHVATFLVDNPDVNANDVRLSLMQRLDKEKIDNERAGILRAELRGANIDFWERKKKQQEWHLRSTRSEGFRKARSRYAHSDAKRKKQREYDSRTGRAAKKAWTVSDSGRASNKRYARSAKGMAVQIKAKRKYRQTRKYRDWESAYAASGKRARVMQRTYDRAKGSDLLSTAVLYEVFKRVLRGDLGKQKFSESERKLINKQARLLALTALKDRGSGAMILKKHEVPIAFRLLALRARKRVLKRKK